MCACTYCGSDVEVHDPLFLHGEDGRLGQFCNAGCLAAHIEADAMAVGDACEWSPE